MSQATGYNRRCCSIMTQWEILMIGFLLPSTAIAPMARCHSLHFPSLTKISQLFQSPPMLPSLLLLSAIIISIVLSHEQEVARHRASTQERSFGRLGLQPLVPPILLIPRVIFIPYLLDSGWIVDHHDFTCLLPISTAAAVMQDFYENLAAYAATTSNPASSSYKLWFGHILLEVLAPPSVIVRWITVQHFALDMLRLTKRGYINTYQINFIHRPSGMMVTFNLYTGLQRTLA